MNKFQTKEQIQSDLYHQTKHDVVRDTLQNFFVVTKKKKSGIKKENAKLKNFYENKEQS